MTREQSIRKQLNVFVVSYNQALSSLIRLTKFKDLMKGVAKNWADGLDSRGKRGSDALKEFDAAVAVVPVK